jgi:hypothetical protein
MRAGKQPKPITAADVQVMIDRYRTNEATRLKLAAATRSLRSESKALSLGISLGSIEEQGNDNSKGLDQNAGLSFDKETKSWLFKANPEAQPRPLKFGGVTYGSGNLSVRAVVDTAKAQFTLQLPRSPNRLQAGPLPSALNRWYYS